MYRKNFCLMMCIVLSIALFCKVSDATPTIHKIRVSPNKTEITVGAKPVALTVKTSGSHLTYQWTLRGLGTLEEPTNESALFYIPPNRINEESVQVIISIKVIDEQKDEASDNIIFNIIKKSSYTGEPRKIEEGESDVSGKVTSVDTEGSCQEGWYPMGSNFTMGSVARKFFNQPKDSVLFEIYSPSDSLYTVSIKTLLKLKKNSREVKQLCERLLTEQEVSHLGSDSFKLHDLEIKDVHWYPEGKNPKNKGNWFTYAIGSVQ